MELLVAVGRLPELLGLLGQGIQNDASLVLVCSCTMNLANSRSAAVDLAMGVAVA
jgi:hypothetical protein